MINTQKKIDKEGFTKKDNSLKINKPKVIVICGPTASPEKLLLSIELAKKINGESQYQADSMQIYKRYEHRRGAKLLKRKKCRNIKHYMLGFCFHQTKGIVQQENIK